MRIAFTLSLVLILAACAFSGQAGENPALLFVGDFETGDFRQFSDTRWKHTMKKSQVVKDPVRRGRYAAKLELDRFKHKNEINYRTDLVPKGYLRQNIGEEYWYAFSCLFPKDWKADTQSELFAQFHASADDADGEKARPPILAIYIYGPNYTVKKRWDVKENSNDSDLDGANCRKLWSRPVAPDAARWVDWVFHVKWSFGNDGFIEAWKDGKKIISDRGPNCYNDKVGPYFRFGPYKWPWQANEKDAPSSVTNRTIFFDEIRIGNSNANFDMVSLQTPKSAEN